MPSPPDPASVFVRKAREDLYLAQRVRDDPNISVEQMGFLCQQTIEKSLKAVLSRHRVRFRRGHDIATYLDLLKADGIDYPTSLEQSVELTPFGAELRYDFLPSEESDATPFDRHAMIRLAEQAIEWAETAVA